MTGLYRALLSLYPTGFRHDHAEAMVAIFADRAEARGVMGRVALLLGAIPETIGNAAVLHWEILRQDLRYTLRTLRRAPGFALTVIFVTALGVGANTAVFSVADFVLLRPLSFPDPESLMRLCEGPRTGPVGWGCMNQMSPANFRDFKEQTKSFEELGAFLRNAVNVVDGGEPQRVASAGVTLNVLPLLGVQPVLGTLFDANAATPGTREVVISFGTWQSRFGGDPGILGRTLNLDGAPHVLIGVMPSTFQFPTREAQLWTPLIFVEDDYADRTNNYLEGVGRLAAGVTFEQARADLDVVVERLAREYPETNEETGVSFFRMRDEFSPRFRLMLQALCGAAICILVLACANLANLSLARAGTRVRELAVRAALGAGKERLVRQMVTESIALALIGGAAGVLVSVATFPLLSLLVPTSLPIGSEPSLNLRMLGLAALFTTLTGLGFGLVPAFRAGGRSAIEALRAGRSGRRQQRARSALVGLEVAASVVLLASAGLLIRAMLLVQATDPGFRSEGALTMRTVLPKPKYESTDRREQFYQEVLNEVRRLPGVQSAGYTTGLPMVVTGVITRAVLPGQEVRRGGDYAVSRRFVSRQFFSTMGIPLISGRDFEDRDASERRSVAVVSESFVERYWPNEEPLGKGFLYNDSLTTVIGVVRDIKVRGLERTSEPQLYLPTSRSQGFHDPKDLAIRTSGSPLALLPAVREVVRRVDPEQPISDVMTISDLLALQTASRAAQVQVLIALAAVALLLAGLGIYGLLAYTVAQMRREIGVRLALGAEPGRIARGIVWNGMSLVLLGMIPGLFAAWAAGRSMNALLFGVQPADPATIVTTIGLCIGMALLGALVPALHAVRVSPMSVMRSE
ncbi:MAG: ABC transporter permease [Gemmatimonadota bacterium]